MGRCVFGVHPVREWLQSRSKQIDTIYVKDGDVSGVLRPLVDSAKRNAIPIKRVRREELDRLVKGGNHQGVVALVSEGLSETLKSPIFEDWLGEVENLEAKPDILLLDGVEDPHNLGALLRSAECLGAGAIIIPKDRSARVTETVVRVSAGAAAYVPVATATNLVRAMKQLKDIGYWMIGLDAEASDSIFDIEIPEPVAWVLGNEGKGIRRLVRQTCDRLTSIPRMGRLGSLNVSVTGGIVLAETLRRRKAG